MDLFSALQPESSKERVFSGTPSCSCAELGDLSHTSAGLGPLYRLRGNAVLKYISLDADQAAAAAIAPTCGRGRTAGAGQQKGLVHQQLYSAYCYYRGLPLESQEAMLGLCCCFLLWAGHWSTFSLSCPPAMQETASPRKKSTVMHKSAPGKRRDSMSYNSSARFESRRIGKVSVSSAATAGLNSVEVVHWLGAWLP